MVKNQNTDNTKCWQGYEATVLMEMQNGIAILEDNLAVSYKYKHTLNKQFGNHAPWYILKGFKTYVYTKTCTQMFIAASSVIVNTWK